jgi:3-deoxy-manno-octulosonate cytidylyltransferase (CMP-KDO synthetase)
MMTSSSGFTVVIPARYQSTRLPAKALADIAGRPMVLRVVDQARLSRAGKVLVATDDARIAGVCRDAGVECMMTSIDHPSGTDRIAEVARNLGLDADSIIVNVQGDEPLIPPAVINQVAENLATRPATGICTLYSPIADEAEFFNHNAVKLVTDELGNVLYFSRAPIPFPRDGMSKACLAASKRHIGLYAYRVHVLEQFTAWPTGALEQIEKLEQLRAMQYGVRIHAEPCAEPIPAGVDTAEDLDAVRRLFGSGQADSHE